MLKNILGLLFLGSTAFADGGEIVRDNCNLYVINRDGFSLNKASIQALLDLNYRVIEMDEQSFAERAKIGDLILGPAAALSVNPGCAFSTFAQKASITLKEVISLDNGINYSLINTRELASSRVVTKASGESKITEIENALHLSLTKYCAPLFLKMVKLLPRCRAK